MSRFLRYLRIAFSATYLIACVLLIVLWIRSYWQHDETTIRLDRSSEWHGIARFIVDSEKGWFTIHFVAKNPMPLSFVIPQVSILGFRWGHWQSYVLYLISPYWLPTTVALIFAALPWIRWSKRFSLRTMLIVTTLVAVVLGLIVYLLR